MSGTRRTRPGHQGVVENQKSESTGSDTRNRGSILRQSCFNPFSAHPRAAMLRNKFPNAETDSEADAHAYQVEFHLFFIPQQSRQH
jgi:hypothetical protein